MTKKHLKLLEKVFEAEILNQLPYQSKAKGFAELHEIGMVEFDSKTLGGQWPIVVSGWCLTHAGRYAYCESCKGVEDGL